MKLMARYTQIPMNDYKLFINRQPINFDVLTNMLIIINNYYKQNVIFDY